MYYTIYRITNTVNGKSYIGKHQTKNLDDGYMGSGKLLKRAIKKYGIDKFKKEILVLCETEQEMDQKEKELVEVGPSSYNLCEGGKGGFDYINRNGLTNCSLGGKIANKICNNVLIERYGIDWRIKLGIIEKLRTGYKLKCPNGTIGNTGQKHSEETKKKISKKLKISSKGSGNSQYGTMWITDGLINKKIKKEDIIPEGWYKGRKYKINAGRTR